MHIYIKKNTIGESYYQQLVKQFPTVTFTDVLSSKVEAAIVTPGVLKKDTLAILPNLKWAQLLTVGYNQVDTDFLKEKNITLTNAKDVYSITIAEDIITKILVLNRNVKTYMNQMQTATWQGYPFEKEIYGSTVGFLGSGSLASAAALRLKAFDTKVICYRKSLDKNPIFDETYHDFAGLETLLKKSDYVVVTLPITKDTYHLLNHERLSMMKKDSLLINVGRGDVIDQDALIDLLEKGLIRGAGLDVTTPEPLPQDSKLWGMQNVFITPHNAPSSPYMLDRLTALVSDNIHRYIKGERLNNVVTL